MLPYAVVEFTSNKSVAIIPMKWFTGDEEDECYWPLSNSKATKMAQNQVSHSNKWKTFNIRVLGITFFLIGAAKY